MARALSWALPLLALAGLLGASAQAQLRGGANDEFARAVENYYHGHASSNAAAAAPVLGRGLVVGEDDAWAPVVRTCCDGFLYLI